MKKILALMLAVLMTFSCFTLISFAETEETATHLTEVPEGYIGVYTKDDLFAVRENPSGKYILMNDITFDDSDYIVGGGFYNSGKGWEPIGTSNTPFSGVFDGNGYNIVNLQINCPYGYYLGLFGYVSGAAISNLNLCDAYILGRDYIGGIVGYVNSWVKISCCMVSGNISGEQKVGGIVGYQPNYYNGSINKSINSANVVGTSDVGGIIGHSYSTDVVNCYNIGSISGNQYVGGIWGAGGYYAEASCSYSIGTITAKSNFNGCFGKSHNYADFCYYLDTSVENGNGGSTPKSYDQLMKKGTFEQWDFDTVWTMEGRDDYPYPELRDVPLVLPDDTKAEITGTVTISGEAKVGSTLTAEMKDLSPADATIEFIWMADGKIVGTDSSYTLTQDDAGKEITLTVKGNGDFKGEVTSSAVVGECVHAPDEFKNNNDATCDKNATQSAVCLNCGKTVTEEIENSKLPHVFSNYIYDNNATCTQDGTKTATCENCTATDTVTAENTKTEHIFSDKWVIDKDATCSEEGVKSHHCRDCDATKDETPLEKTNHKYISSVTEATCNEDGKIIYTCSCGDAYSKIIYAAGHNDADGNGRCDGCDEVIKNSEDNENDTDCKCICHETGIFSVLYKILSTLQRYFKIDLLGNVLKMGQVCACGEYHY